VPDEIEIEPENGDAVKLFLAMATQWRQIALSGAKAAIVMRSGLDYAALPAAAEALGFAKARLTRAFRGFQVLEREALRLMDEEAAARLRAS
jgi:hypothetical protein